MLSCLFQSDIFNKSFQPLQCYKTSVVLVRTVAQYCDATFILDGIIIKTNFLPVCQRDSVEANTGTGTPWCRSESLSMCFLLPQRFQPRQPLLLYSW